MSSSAGPGDTYRAAKLNLRHNRASTSFPPFPPAAPATVLLFASRSFLRHYEAAPFALLVGEALFRETRTAFLFFRRSPPSSSSLCLCSFPLFFTPLHLSAATQRGNYVQLRGMKWNFFVEKYLPVYLPPFVPLLSFSRYFLPLFSLLFLLRKRDRDMFANFWKFRWWNFPVDSLIVAIDCTKKVKTVFFCIFMPCTNLYMFLSDNRSINVQYCCEIILVSGYVRRHACFIILYSRDHWSSNWSQIRLFYFLIAIFFRF